MEGIYCRTSSTSSSSTEIPKRKWQHTQDKPYRGIRMRKWGKWVAEIRETNKRSRIWLDSYSSPVAAVRAYDTAVFHLRPPQFPRVRNRVRCRRGARFIRRRHQEEGDGGRR
ncbi:hypothetical protein ACS0TY_003127 [Phlomoides rotata]